MRWRKISLNLLHGAAVLALVCLVISNWRLRRAYDATRAQLSALAERAIVPFRPGDLMPPLEVVDRAGHPATLGPASWKHDSYVALVLPTCGPCREEIAAAENAKLPNVVVVSLVRRQLAAKALEQVSPEVTLYFASGTTTSRLRHRLNGFPSILRVASGGKIIATCRSIVGCGEPACATCDLPK
jgi:hypothetical protein